MEEIIVADIMTTNPITIKPSTNLFECAKIMINKRVGTLLITNNKKLVGIISQKDIIWAITKKPKKDLKTIRAIEISPKKIATIAPSATVKQAYLKMKKLKFEKFPVIHDGDLVGIITARDILNFHPEIYPEFEEVREIKQEAEKLKRLKRAKSRSFTREGLCEECGNFGMLIKIDGRLICESCKSMM